ncbi:hypothetical protein PTKIN_Ptkin06aG0132200 [Pterospermum kingtungense]
MLVFAVSSMKDEFFTVLGSQQTGLWSGAGGWNPPPHGYHKINVDAVYSAITQEASLGVVVCDAAGVVSASAALRIRGLESSFQAELHSILFGLQCAQDLSLMYIRLEIDCLLAVNEVRKGAYSFSEWFGLVQDILDIARLFPGSDFLHVKCGFNRLADSIAKCDSVDFVSTIWRNSLPSNVCNLDVITM